MHAALQRGWPLAMVIQIHQKVDDLGEGSTHTTYDWNEEKMLQLEWSGRSHLQEVPTAAAEAGPSGNPTDGSAPPIRIHHM